MQDFSDDEKIGCPRGADLIGVTRQTFSNYLDRGLMKYELIEGRMFITGAELRAFLAKWPHPAPLPRRGGPIYEVKESAR